MESKNISKTALKTIKANLQELQDRIAGACRRSHRNPADITMIAITKMVDAATLRAAYECGIEQFGENRVQDAEKKINELSDIKQNITWHMVGHLQSNKAKLAAELFDIIHSVDCVKIAQMLDHHTQKSLSVLVQVNVSGEMTKFGVPIDEVPGLIDEISRLPNLQIKGLMTVAPMVSDPEQVRPVFQELRRVRDRFGLEHLSMGMTDDFETAIEEGATMVRIGRAIFRDRRLSCE
jgi:pyridoxal phosphate enzyme (YggS family)